MHPSFGLTVLVVVLVTLSVLPSADARAKCVEGDSGSRCFNCARKGTCEDVPEGRNVKPLDPCPNDMACTMVEGVAVCKPVDETECNCGGKQTGCDIYDPQRENFCVPGLRPMHLTTCDEPQVCSPMGCTGPPSNFCKKPDRNETGYYLNYPDCSSATLCHEKKNLYVLTCEAGKYYNTKTDECETYPPDPCADCGKDYCPILSDPQKYAACADGKLIAEETCLRNKVFHFENQNCRGESDSPYIECDFSLIQTPTTTTTVPTTTSTTTTSTTTTSSTTTPSTTSSTTTTSTTTPTTTTTSKPATCTAANANTRYPHETDCKKFYTCREIRRNTYSYVESTCVSNLVFNSGQRYCDIPANVPNCA